MAEDHTATPAERDVLRDAERAIAWLESHADAAVGETARTLLEAIDAVHRTGLTHLVQAIHALAGDALLNRLTTDPAIRLLLASYNLIAVDRRLQAEEALDTVRGHLHDQGVDVEILEVSGGVVYVRLHPSQASSGILQMPVDAVRRDIEAALRLEFIGFQELVLRERDAQPAAAAFVPLGTLKRVHRPLYRDAGPADVPLGSVRAADLEGVPILLAHVDGEVYAIRNRCGESPLPLEFGTLDGAELRCSWHGCRYSVRTGRRLDAPGSVQVFPVSIQNGRIQVALAVEPSDGHS